MRRAISARASRHRGAAATTTLASARRNGALFSGTSSMQIDSLLWELGVNPASLAASAGLTVRTPIDGSVLGTLAIDDAASIARKIDTAQTAFRMWRTVPAPRRGELVRVFGEHLRRHKSALGRLVSIESGKILQEGLGEVQEMIDICDFAVGLSRQLYGLTIASERPGHRMMETWHPLGPTAVVSAFNFPVAVWAWNAALAWVCGNPVVWKPSEKTPLTALACQRLFERAVAKARAKGSDVPEGLSSVVRGGRAHRGTFRAHAPRAWRQQRDDRGAERRPRARRARDHVLRGRHRRAAL